ncbi:MAG: DUF4240 domain-containing protein [Bacteroidia bacterium]
MNEVKFWFIIDSAKKINNNNIVEQRESIENTLSDYPIEDIRHFNYLMEFFISGAKDAGINEFIDKFFNDEISNNGFDFFMGWLILQGSALYNQSIKDPFFLKEVIEINYNKDFDVLKCEEALHISSKAYEIKTGRNYFEDF